MSEFFTRFAKFARANPDMLVAIEANLNPAQFPAEADIAQNWLAYLDARGYRSEAALVRGILGGGGKAVTFPCEKPEIFDPAYVARGS